LYSIGSRNIFIYTFSFEPWPLIQPNHGALDGNLFAGLQVHDRCRLNANANLLISSQSRWIKKRVAS